MQAEITRQASPRRPHAAFLLSFLAAGLGQIYCGRFGKGILLLAITLFLEPLGGLAIVPIRSWLRTAGMVACVAAAGVWVYSMIDARRLARKIGADYVLKDYNRWYFYLVMTLISLPLAVGFAFQVRAHVAAPFYVPTDSMYPTIHRGDRLMANKLAYRSDPLGRGEIVVFPNPNDRRRNFIRRAVGLPGDTVEIKANDVYINGEKLRRTRADTQGDEKLAGEVFWEINGAVKYRIVLTQAADTAPTTGPAAPPSEYPPTKVPNGHCFVLADNRNHAADSRAFGPVPLRDITGRAEFIYFPRWVRLAPSPADE